MVIVIMDKLLKYVTRLSYSDIKSINVNMMLAFKASREGKYQDALNYLNKVVVNNDKDAKELLEMKCFCMRQLNNQNAENKSVKRKKVIFTMTTCKRYDLFKRSIDSFLLNCKDTHLIDEWLIVDDGSSVEDLQKMAMCYPYMKIYVKSPNEKGHSNSMNIIKEFSKDYEYVYHMEDDHEYIRPDSYITKCMRVLSLSDKYGQCLVNKNYMEDQSEENITVHGLFKKSDDLVYYEHEHYTNQEEKKVLYDKYFPDGKAKEHMYWPHYSLRPGLIKVSVLKDVGQFNNVVNFENEYAQRYFQKGYRTCFLNELSCVHIGRKTWERHSDKENAYTLNNEKQFSDSKQSELKTETKVEQPKAVLTTKNGMPFVEIEKSDKTIEKSDSNTLDKSDNKINPYSCCYTVINLERRPDRKQKFIENNKSLIINGKPVYEFISAVDGQALSSSPQIMKLCETGDYNYRRGIIGVALNEIVLLQRFLASPNQFLIKFEDDAIVSDKFIEYVDACINHINKNGNNGILYFGHFPYKQYDKPEYYTLKNPNVKLDNLNISQWSNQECLTKSMGGAFGMLITREAAVNTLKYLSSVGMTNAIDWMYYKANIPKYFVEPHLVFSKCVQSSSEKVDSDIQHDYTTLYQTPIDRMKTDVNVWKTILNEKGVIQTSELCNHKLNLELDEKSDILITTKLPDKSVLFKKVVFLITNDYSNDLNVIQEYKVLKFYTHLQNLIISIPDPIYVKHKQIIDNNIPLGGRYL